MIRLALILSLALPYVTVRGQEPLFNRHEIGDVNTGIPINAILQDHQCMIWLATNNGLARYDGINWFPIHLDTTSSSEHITSLFEDGQGKIWIGTASGKIYFLDQARKINKFSIEEGNPSKPITAITQDEHAQIWFATYGEGVYVYTGKRLYNFDVDDGLSGQDIYSMTLTPGGDIWLGTDDGINICSFLNEQKTIKKLSLKDGLPDQIITCLQTDDEGNVWIGTFEHGVVRYDEKSMRIIKEFENDGIGEITSFEIFDGAELWIGTKKSGVWRYHLGTQSLRHLVTIRNSFPGEVTDILSDAEGNIWISMEEGVLLSAFRPFESLHTGVEEIQTLYSDKKNNLWIGSRHGLFRLQEKSDNISEAVRIAPRHDFNITDIEEDKYGNLWIGTLDQGLFIYQPDKGSVVHPASNLLTGNTIMSIAATQKDIWIATLQGVISFPADKNIINERKPVFDLVNDPWQSSLHFVFQIYVDSKDRAWFATDGNGVYCIDEGKVTQYTGNDSLVIRTVYSICEDRAGHMWFNTGDFGLIEFDGALYKPLGVNEGLGNMTIASIITSGTGDIVIAHDRGIDLMEPERRHFMYYGEEAGVSDIEPGLNAVAVDTKGHVYISSGNDIIKYYATEYELSIHPRTQLTGITVYEKPVDYLEENRFSYHENYISFAYVGLWYTSPKSVKYLYKLDGYDLQWKESKDNVASYSSLPPGDYTFYVKASENRFFLDEPLASYSFSIERPFWVTYWFIGSVLLLLVAILYLIVKAREKRSERQAIIRKDMIESQLQALKAQINPHFLFNSFNTLITIIDENSDKPDVAIEYVEKLSDFFRSILQYREQETITLEEEWELVQNYGYLLQKRYGSNLRLHMSAVPGDGYILPLTLQMLVENAVKHNVITEQKPLDVYITYDRDGYVTVKNNLQPKSKPEPSTQFGLQSIIKRYNLLSEQKVMIEKDPEFFRVRIPIIKRTKP